MKPQILMAGLLILGGCSQEAETPAAESAVLEQSASEPESTDDVPETMTESSNAPADSVPVLAEVAPTPPAPSQPAEPAAATERDARMVGIWVNENNINSGGGNFASYSTVMTMELHPDGRVLQYTESAGGGGDWTYDGGRTLDFDGQWRADGQTLYVYAAPLPDFTPAATYSFSGEYLVTQSDMGRLIWQRRG